MFHYSRSALALFCIALAISWASSLRAADYTWAGMGKVKAGVPAGWTVEAGTDTSRRFHLKLTAPAGRKAGLQLTMVRGSEVISSRSELEASLLKSLEGSSALTGSVEGKAELLKLPMDAGIGCYAQFTDKNLVGKAAAATEFRLLRMVQGIMDARVLVSASLVFDDATQPEVEEMMAMLKTLKIELAP